MRAYIPTEAVSELREQVIAQERKSLLVRKHNETEFGMDVNDRARLRCQALLHCIEGNVFGRKNSPPVAEEHLSVFHKALENADDLCWCLVGLINYEASAVLDR